jgi:ribosomal protein S14
MLTNNALINNNNSESLMLYKVKLLDVIQKITKKSSLSFVKNYCFYVGRSRSTNRKVFMARHTFRKFARFGMLPGFIKERI